MEDTLKKKVGAKQINHEDGLKKMEHTLKIFMMKLRPLQINQLPQNQKEGEQKTKYG